MNKFKHVVKAGRLVCRTRKQSRLRQGLLQTHYGARADTINVSVS